MSGELDVELLTNTRKRRANAGSRLKQLLKAEEIANEGEEEDVDLLFQEDEDDAEFQVGDKDKYGYQGSASEEEGNEEEGDSDGDGDKSDQSDNEMTEREGTADIDDTKGDDDSDAAQPEDNDDMFSDSEDEDSGEEDSDEGERELQKQERAKKRQAQKKARQIPKITAKPKVAAPKKKVSQPPPKADTLLSLNRRQSSRMTAVQNKMDLVERLKEDEERRQSIKPVAKVEYVELTQEERLIEALETEKYNISTLNKYKEQEIDKKKKQRALQLSKRKRLENIVSYKTTPVFVTPVEEHELEHFLMHRDTIRRKRDRRGRKSEKQKREEEEARLKEEARKKRAAMFIIQPKSLASSPDAMKKLRDENEVKFDALELPESSAPPESQEGTAEPTTKETETDSAAKTDNTNTASEPKEEDGGASVNEDEIENDKKRPLSEESSESADHKRTKVEGENEADGDITSEEQTAKLVEENISTTEGRSEEKDTSGDIVKQDETEDNLVSEQEKSEEKVQKTLEASPSLDAQENEKKEEVTEGSKEETKQEENINEEPVVKDPDGDVQVTVTEDVATEKPEDDEEVPVAEEVKTEAPTEKGPNDQAISVKVEDADEKLVKTVKFADEEEQKETKPKEDKSREASTEVSSRETSAPVDEQPKIVFEGPPQKVAANYVSFEESSQKYTIDEIKAYLFGPQSLLPVQRKSHDVEPLLRLRADDLQSSSVKEDQLDESKDLPDFEFLNNFPKFGEYNKVKKEQVVLETREDIKVVLKTQPPSGIHLPNGAKKQCLITGKPAMYFDPKTGLPYGSVDAYKVIKDIQNGVWAWTEFPGGGSYVCNRETHVHAKGVPEGFDE